MYIYIIANSKTTNSNIHKPMNFPQTTKIKTNEKKYTFTVYLILLYFTIAAEYKLTGLFFSCWLITLTFLTPEVNNPHERIITLAGKMRVQLITLAEIAAFLFPLLDEVFLAHHVINHKDVNYIVLYNA